MTYTQMLLSDQKGEPPPYLGGKDKPCTRAYLVMNVVRLFVSSNERAFFGRRFTLPWYTCT